MSSLFTWLNGVADLGMSCITMAALYSSNNSYTWRSYQDGSRNSIASFQPVFSVASPRVSKSLCNPSSLSIFNEGGNCASKHPFFSPIFSTTAIKSSTSFTANCNSFVWVIILETLQVNRKLSGTLPAQLATVELLGSL